MVEEQRVWGRGRGIRGGRRTWKSKLASTPESCANGFFALSSPRLQIGFTSFIHASAMHVLVVEDEARAAGTPPGRDGLNVLQALRGRTCRRDAPIQVPRPGGGPNHPHGHPRGRHPRPYPARVRAPGVSASAQGTCGVPRDAGPGRMRVGRTSHSH